MKKLALISTVAAVACTGLNASPLITVGEDLDIFFNGSFIGAWDSNVFNRRNNLRDKAKSDDYVYTFRVGTDINYGRDSKFNVNIRFWEDFREYCHFSVADAQLANLYTEASYTEDRWSLTANFNFVQVADNNDSTVNLLNDVARKDTFYAGLRGTYNFTDKLNGELGFSWYNETYDKKFSNLYSDRDSYSVPVSLLYRVTDNINAGLTYQYRHTEYTGGTPGSAARYGNEVDDHFVGLTLRGTLTPRISTVLSAGMGYRDMSNSESSSETTFSFDARFDYKVTDKISAYITGFRNFGNGAARQSVTNTGTKIGISYDIMHSLRAYTSFGYTNSDYMIDPRDDDYIVYTVGAVWSFARYWKLSASYSYYDNMSNMDSSSYFKHYVMFNLNFRY